MKYILKFILIPSLFFTLLGADNINECKTDIYFGNGVWNKQFVSDCEEDSAANCSQDTLNDLIESEIIKDDPKLKAKYGEVKLQYNWGQGAMLDVLETYYQLREAGQVEDYQFFAVIYALTGANSTLTLSAVASQALMEPFTRDWEQGNADEMWQKYYDESFKLSHKVLLISHSQGNLFANRIYDTINPTEYKNYFANLQIASPASEVKAEKGDYVTLSTDLTSVDPVINFIPGSMSPNASGESGHAFVSAYLSQADPLNKITSKIQQLLVSLDAEPSQWELEQEKNVGTKDYKITLKHRFDYSINVMNDVEVYPFNASKKLYHVIDNTGGNGWVKASCGGEEVFDYWDGQEDNEMYIINNYTNETINYYQPCYQYSYAYEILPVVDYIDSEGFPIYYYPYNKYLITTNICPSCEQGYSTIVTFQLSGVEGMTNNSYDVGAIIYKYGSLASWKSMMDSYLIPFLQLQDIDTVSSELIQACKSFN
jgi:hypothetical protein